MWYPCNVIIIIVIILLSLSQIFSNNNFVVCWRKSECRSHVHPLGLLRISRPPGSLVPGFPHCLCSHRGGEPGHDHHHQDQSQTPHPHVLFSQSLVLCWFLLFHHSYTQTLGEFGCGRQNHLFHRMHHAILLGLCVCSGRGIHVGSDALWLICGHL